MYSRDVTEAAVGLVRSGMSASGAARRLGIGRSTVEWWCRLGGVRLRPGRIGGPVRGPVTPAAPLPPRASPRARLDQERRALIADRRRAGLGVREIARELGVSHSTVSRELRRNARPDGRYDAGRAARRARERASRPRAGRLERDPRLRAEVVRRLALLWSPAQVSASLAADFPDDEEMRAGHETIYRAPCVRGRGSLREELAVELVLRSGRRSRRRRSLPAEPRGRRTWVEGAELAPGPPEADDRSVPGHWEGDLVVGADGRACLVTLVERSSRFLLCSRLDEHTAETVAARLAAMVSSLPAALRRTLTWDQGCEMARWRGFAEATGFEVRFCDPRSPWQRGTNENTNGLLRQFFPKGTDFSLVSDGEVARAQDLLNGRPRKTLGWRTPAEELARTLAEDGAITE
ncbi:IS30 family transposase [Thermophilibacter sp.]